MTGDLIVIRENEAAQITQLAAQRQLYSWAKVVMAIQLVSAIAIAIGGAYLQSTIKTAEPYVVISGAAFALLDVLLLDPTKSRLQRLAARVQELFDCTVLDLPWRELKASKPEYAEVVEHSKRICGDQVAVAKLNNWYPEAVKDLPFRPARILCQRENCHYDSRLRHKYIFGVTTILILLSVATFLIGLIQNLSFVETLASIVAPLIPAYVISIREISANRESLERLERLKMHAEDLWRKALEKTATEQELDDSSRLIQDEIFEHRMRSPVVFSWVYDALRSSNESLMSVAAGQLAAEYKKRHP